jgi:class 3 adenylate cyclase
VTLADELKDKVKEIFADGWSERDGQTVPDSPDIGLGNDGVNLTAAVLYADLASSTKLVDNYKPKFAAEIYKTYLYCAARIIRAESGTITAYDGDRVMAVYIGDSKCTSAARTALKINWCVKKIIQPAIQKQYQNTDYTVKQKIGIDVSELFVARTGIRGSNDLVWVGRAANYAAKLAALSSNYPTYITGDAFDLLNKSAKYGGTDNKLMWEERAWTDMNNMRIYRSSWWWSL